MEKYIKAGLFWFTNYYQTNNCNIIRQTIYSESLFFCKHPLQTLDDNKVNFICFLCFKKIDGLLMVHKPELEAFATKILNVICFSGYECN